MPTALRHNLTSAYLDAARRLTPRKRRRIVAYVESYDDVAFWRTLLSEFEDDTRYFQVMLPSSTSLAKGKKMVLMNTLNTDELGHSLIACVDSDYDFLLQDATRTSRKINRNPYIFQTYGYAIESFQCYAESLHEVCVQATLNDRLIVDLPAFMRRYSQIAYPLLLWNVWFYRRRDTDTFPMHELNACTLSGIHPAGESAGAGTDSAGPDARHCLPVYAGASRHGRRGAAPARAHLHPVAPRARTGNQAAGRAQRAVPQRADGL